MSQRSPRRAAPALMVLAALAAASACAPPPPAPSGWSRGYLTRDGGGAVTYLATPGALSVAATAGTTGGNTRAIAWPDGPDLGDQQACTTPTDTGGIAQPGVALHVVAASTRLRAVTVTVNVWAGARWIYNVHVWDTARGGLLPADLVAQFDLAADLAGSTAPRRLCARTVGGTLELKVWPTDRPEPAWDAPSTRRAALPPGATAPGRPGLYSGHLVAGASIVHDGVALGQPG